MPTVELTAPVVAHAGHWAIQLAYFAPVLAFLAWLLFAQLRNRDVPDDERDGVDG